ncbi:DUF6488 family protein [Kordiimonas pumila]|uniref:DUF6488 family protein n=1 Tax=Kordiimonas pumila TaxID=2161677 RepID=A0ABV7D486_9PROT|nr:DUF6488 family protein [Kordiimonas pumila]
MLKKTLLSVCLLVAATFSANAHPGGHGGVIPEDEAAMIATQQITRLVDAEKLPSSWALSKLEKVELREDEEANEYIVVFTNPKATDPTQQTLYIFLTESGEYIAANYSGL